MNKIIKFYYKTLHLSLLLIKRDFKKLSLSLVSLVVGAVILTFILSAQESLGGYIQSQTKALVGGDITVRVSAELIGDESEIFTKLQKISQKSSTKITTNVIARGNGLAVLSFITVVSANYPVYGEVLLAGKKWSFPSDDEIYVEKNLLSRLEIEIGEKITIGDHQYAVAAILEALPDQLVGGFSFGPRILLSEDAFAKTGIDKKSSRITYRYDLAVPESQITEMVKKQLREDFKPLSGSINFASEGAGSELSVLDNIKKFLITLSVLTLFLVVINVRSTMAYLFLDYRRTISLYKVLGMTPVSAVFVFILILSVIAIISGIIGVVVGNILLNILLPVAENIISADLVNVGIVNGFWSVLAVITTITILGALSILISISKVSPKEIFLSAIKTSVLSVKSLEFLVVIFSLAVLVGVVWLLSGSIFWSFISVISLFIIFAVLTLIFVVINKFIYKIRFSLSNKVRYISNFINMRGVLGISNYAALVLAITILFSITGIENALQKSIETDISREVPNLYLIDIQKDQQEGLKEIFADTDLTLFPSVRGKLLYVDDFDIQKNYKENREYTRNFSNTYRTEFISGEVITKGIWHGNLEKGAVSVDENVAKDLNIEIGSSVTFGIEGREVTAEVTSLRNTGEAGFGAPFFYFVFSPDVIGDAPQSSFAFSFVDSEKIPGIQNIIADKFSNISTIPTNDLLDFVIKISSLFSKVLIIMSLPALVLGSLLVWSQLLYATRERILDLGLFKLFGMSKKSSLVLYAHEMFFLVLGSVVFSFILSRIAIWAILKFSFDLPMVFSIESYFYLTSLGSIIIVLALVLYFTKQLYAGPSAKYFSNK
jgi:putative ABC transport system permease protein